MNNCILHEGYLDKDGYGNKRFRGNMWRAHRVAWVQAYGEIPEGMFVLHKCDMPSCINPNHLFLGTHTDNMRDKWNKGRGFSPIFRGENHPRARLKDSDIENIKSLLAHGVPAKEVAELYEMDKSYLYKVKNGKFRNLKRVAMGTPYRLESPLRPDTR